MPLPGRLKIVPAALFLFFGLIIAILPHGILSSYHTDTATRVGIYFIAILSLNLVLGYCGQISLGQGALMLVGAYTTAILNAKHGWTIVETLPVAFIISFIIGALLGLPALRLGGIYLALVTFAFAFAMPQLPLKFDNFFGGGNGLGFEPKSALWVYNVTWILAGLLLIAVWLLVRGRTGRAFRAIRDSETAAVSSGVSLPMYKVIAFAMSGGIAGLAGSMFAAVNNSFVSPGAFTVLLSLTILIGGAVAGLRLAVRHADRGAVRRHPARPVVEHPRDRDRPRADRRLRRHRDPRHVPDAQRLRRRPARPRSAADAVTTTGRRRWRAAAAVAQLAAAPPPRADATERRRDRLIAV